MTITQIGARLAVMVATVFVAACTSNEGELPPPSVYAEASGSVTVPASPDGQSDRPRLVMYKTPWCGCCGDWGDHARANGFEVVEHDLEDLTGTKRRYGITDRLASCHTAVVEGYVVEGHVPAREIHRLLRERPQARGLTVPGMPIGSPGMEQGDRVDPYDVLLIDQNGGVSVFARYGR